MNKKLVTEAGLFASDQMYTVRRWFPVHTPLNLWDDSSTLAHLSTLHHNSDYFRNRKNGLS
jgi:hypothetical protein